MIQAHIARASALVITLADSLRTHQMVSIALELNPEIRIVVHAANEEEARLLRDKLRVEAFQPEQELSRSLAQQVMQWSHPGGRRATDAGHRP